MKHQTFRKSVRLAIKQILLEQASNETSDKPDKPDKPEKPADKPDKPDKSDKPKKKKKGRSGEISIVTGATGRGKFKKFVDEAGARAQKDPAGLMKDLGIKSASGGDIEAIHNILNTAIHMNQTMGEAYTGANISQEQLEDGTTSNIIAVYPSGISNRDGIKFVLHTLTGAKNAGILNLQGAAEINKGINVPIAITVV